jgi:hypothetical protein
MNWKKRLCLISEKYLGVCRKGRRKCNRTFSRTGSQVTCLVYWRMHGAVKGYRGCMAPSRDTEDAWRRQGIQRMHGTVKVYRGCMAPSRDTEDAWPRPGIQRMSGAVKGYRGCMAPSTDTEDAWRRQGIQRMHDAVKGYISDVPLCSV